MKTKIDLNALIPPVTVTAEDTIYLSARVIYAEDMPPLHLLKWPFHRYCDGISKIDLPEVHERADFTAPVTLFCRDCLKRYAANGGRVTVLPVYADVYPVSAGAGLWGVPGVLDSIRQAKGYKRHYRMSAAGERAALREFERALSESASAYNYRVDWHTCHHELCLPHLTADKPDWFFDWTRLREFAVERAAKAIR